MFSFLKKENEEGEVKSSNTSDIVTLAVIAVLAVGGYFWFQAEKSAKAEALKQAETVFKANKIEEAHALFCELSDECPAHRGALRNLVSPIMGNYGVSDSAMDKVIFEKFEYLDSISDAQEDHYLRAEEAKGKNDLQTLTQEIQLIPNLAFLDAEEKSNLQKWRQELSLPPLAQ